MQSYIVFVVTSGPSSYIIASEITASVNKQEIKFVSSGKAGNYYIDTLRTNVTKKITPCRYYSPPLDYELYLETFESSVPP